MDEFDGLALCVAIGLLGWLVSDLYRAHRELARDIALVAEDPVLYRAKYAASGDSDQVRETS
jgi:hypothetical protein